MREIMLLLLALSLFDFPFHLRAESAKSNEGHIGCALQRPNASGFLVVEYVAADSPAATAGIQKGDCIAEIDGIPTLRMTDSEAWHFLNGSIGGIVTLTIRRQGTLDREVSITRRSLLDTYLPAATAGDPSAEVYIGRFYFEGPISSRDLGKAALWYRKAADQGFAPAQGFLGYMYVYGLGLPKDQSVGFNWFLKSAKQGDAFAERELALCYLYGVGVRQSDEDAFKWFYSAAQQEDSQAEEYLGYLYENGRGVNKDDREAFHWYNWSAHQDNVYGEWGLAVMYATGRGVAQNSLEALKWYQKAHDGLPESKEISEDLVVTSLKVFVETHEPSVVNLSLVKAVFHREILFASLFLTAIYIAIGIVLFRFTFRTPDVPPKLFTTIGWIGFYLESQGVALVAVLFFERSLTADMLLIAISIVSALPVIASTLGSQRNQAWRQSQASWISLLLYGVASCVAILAINVEYHRIYPIFAHSPLPAQSTEPIFIRAKLSSVWLAYITTAFVLPIAEEIMFRGYLFDALRTRLSGQAAVLTTALAFSAIHFQANYLLPLFAFGVVLGWLKLKTDSLRLPLLLHAANNGLFITFIFSNQS
jgi:TPR repeat protein/membrane protease YdiL (CAAX protease family)